MHIAIISSFPPKTCGVGEFCSDLVAELVKLQEHPIVSIYAIDDTKNGYPYQSFVTRHFFYQDQSSYTSVAQEINASSADICLVQHEFNLFGGEHNEYIFDLVESLRKPVVVVLHNITLDPSNEKYSYRAEQMKRLNRTVNRFISITNRGKEGLIQFEVPKEKIAVIMHGAPKELLNLPPKEILKQKLSLENIYTVMTFGLIRPKKGIQYLLEALHICNQKNIAFRCLIVGPQDKNQKNLYLEQMKQYSSQLNLTTSVRFIEKYFTKQQMYDYIGASDIVVTPYLRRDQVSSGVLAFSVGAGVPVISTPYIFAQELLEDIGILIPFADSKALAEEIEKLVTDHEFYKKQSNSTRLLGKTLSWEEKAKEYMSVLKHEVTKASKAQLKYESTS